MRRREFITLIGASAALPFAASAQQPALPVIGFLTALSKIRLSTRSLNFIAAWELDTAFRAIAAQHPGGLLIGSDPFIRRNDIIAFGAHNKIPAIYPFREFADSGGTGSYGTNIANAYRQAGIYAGRILKGATPAELPVVQPTKFKLVINLKTAETLGFAVPPMLPARSDEVIEWSAALVLP